MVAHQVHPTEQRASQTGHGHEGDQPLRFRAICERLGHDGILLLLHGLWHRGVLEIEVRLEHGHEAFQVRLEYRTLLCKRGCLCQMNADERAFILRYDRAIAKINVALQ